MKDYCRRAIEQYQLGVHYNEAVNTIRPLPKEGFVVETSKDRYEARRCVIAIGILDKPNKPDYRIPVTLNTRVHYDLTSGVLENTDCLVVGGGDTASVDDVIENSAVGLPPLQREPISDRRFECGKKGGSINLAFNMAEEAMRNICKRMADACGSGRG